MSNPPPHTGGIENDLLKFAQKMCGQYTNAKDMTELMKLVDVVMREGFVPLRQVQVIDLRPV